MEEQYLEIRLKFLQIAEPLTILTSERLCLPQVLIVYPIMLLMLQINLNSCNMILQLFLFSIAYSSSLFVQEKLMF